MYNDRYSRRGFRFRWLPFCLGFLFLMMVLSGGFHRMWFFVWPLFFALPFFLVVGVVIMFVKYWWRNGPPKRKNDEFFYDAKPKRGDDSDSEIFYV